MGVVRSERAVYIPKLTNSATCLNPSQSTLLNCQVFNGSHDGPVVLAVNIKDHTGMRVLSLYGCQCYNNRSYV